MQRKPALFLARELETWLTGSQQGRREYDPYILPNYYIP